MYSQRVSNTVPRWPRDSGTKLRRDIGTVLLPGRIDTIYGRCLIKCKVLPKCTFWSFTDKHRFFFIEKRLSSRFVVLGGNGDVLGASLQINHRIQVGFLRSLQ